MRRLAIVVQRYGTEITGGAEYHARWVAGKLRDRFDITVFTTTALDYINWENHYPAGEDEVEGIRVLRYPVEKPRDMERFKRYCDWLYRQPHRDADEERWLRDQGPYSPGLIEALRRERTRHDLFFFFTYLYYSTVRGLPAVAPRAVMQPTAHDEPPLKLRIFDDLFAACGGFLLNTATEGRMLDRRFGLGRRPRSIVGMGIDWPDEVDPAPTLAKYGLTKPYALSFGRISDAKGYGRILDGFPSGESPLDLVLFGKSEMELPEAPWLHYLGRVSDEERWALIVGSALTIHPSPYESLSLALLESWAVGVPALVNACCEVLADHVKACGGGLGFGGDFAGPFLELATKPRDELAAMGEAGRKYVRANYEAGEVARRYAEFFNSMIDMLNR